MATTLVPWRLSQSFCYDWRTEKNLRERIRVKDEQHGGRDA